MQWFRSRSWYLDNLNSLFMKQFSMHLASYQSIDTELVLLTIKVKEWIIYQHKQILQNVQDTEETGKVHIAIKSVSKSTISTKWIKHSYKYKRYKYWNKEWLAPSHSKSDFKCDKWKISYYNYCNWQLLEEVWIKCHFCECLRDCAQTHHVCLLSSFQLD